MPSQLRLLIFAALGAASPGLVGCGLGGPKSQPDDEDGDLWRVPFDCDDRDAGVYPGATERCDGVDNDCDGAVDSFLWGQDLDGDGFSAPSPWSVCDDPPPVVANAGDCDDADPLIFPGAGEVCGDGVDSDCDGKVSCLAVSIVTETTSCDYVWALRNIWAFDAPCEGCSFWFEPRSYVLQPASNIVDCDPDFVPRFTFEFREHQLYYADYFYGETLGSLTSSTGGWDDGIFGLDHTFDDVSSSGTVNERWFGEFNIAEVQYRRDDDYVGGRPFTVGGLARLARLDAQGDAWSDAAAAVAGPPPVHLQRHIADRWAQLGRMEHASVGSFAR
ncbi:MAG: putative metal-binding motif-containing protein, partial [Deltaproteobacteria bacterium]|nr:putative metal-binding motif-containing protein [Deltaproteobacteria bacterium]